MIPCKVCKGMVSYKGCRGIMSYKSCKGIVLLMCQASTLGFGSLNPWL